MRRFAPLFAAVITLAAARPAEAYFFTTESVAVQTLTSPLFDPTGMGNPTSIVLTSAGPQQYSGDLGTGLASVASQFQTTTFPTPFGSANADLYNTTTTGTIVSDGLGGYNVTFSLLFEMMITSGPLAGVTFETLDFTNFSAANIPSIPFPVGTTFSSPKPLALYLKADPTNGALGVNVGDLVGFSSGRTVAITALTPVPPTAVLFAGAPALFAGLRRLRRRAA